MPPRVLAAYLAQAIAIVPLLGVAALAAGLALAPAFYFFDCASAFFGSTNIWIEYLGRGFAVVLGYLVYGVSLILIAPLLNLILRARLKPWRGSAVSLSCLPWYIHSCLTLVVRMSFLEFVTPSPLALLFYRLMGMKIGSGVTINSTAIADPSLIELGDRVTIGGSASVLAHYGQGGYLVIAPVSIGADVTIGLRAIVMGGTTIGAKAKVLAGSFVLPNTNVPAGETWGGIPAAKVELSTSQETEE